jgi:hypothetical protein
VARIAASPPNALSTRIANRHGAVSRVTTSAISSMSPKSINGSTSRAIARIPAIACDGAAVVRTSSCETRMFDCNAGR